MLVKATENYGDYRENDSIASANYFYKLALQRYREIPHSYRKNLQENYQDLIQEKITQSGLLIKDILQLVSIPGIDISEQQKQIINHVKENTLGSIMLIVVIIVIFRIINKLFKKNLINK